MSDLTRRTVLASAAAGAFLASSRRAPAAGSALQKLRFVSWSTPRAEQANFFAAQELGYFEKQGIDFEYLPGSGTGDALKQIVAGNGDVGFVGPETIYFAAEQGGDVVGIYNLYPQSMFVLIAWPGAGIKKPSDLKGKTIGVLSLGSGGRYSALSVLALNGMSESDVNFVATGPSPGPFLQHKIDVWSTLVTSTATLERQTGQTFYKIPVRDYLNLPTDILAATGRTLANQPDLLLRFLRALKQGTQYMIDHPAEAAAIAVKKAQDITDPAQAEIVIRAFAQASMSPHGLGVFDLAVMQSGADAYKKNGLITTSIDAKHYFGNSLVSKL